jgi:hypothetical protein
VPSLFLAFCLLPLSPLLDQDHAPFVQVTHVAMAFEVQGGWRQEKTAAIMKVMQV